MKESKQEEKEYTPPRIAASQTATRSGLNCRDARQATSLAAADRTAWRSG
jgi:hypothetical protein